MLRFTKLEINNFGPYQSTQVIDFPTDDGVVIIWGYNGVGKTTILKAIRFALWGKIINENNVEDPISSYVNHEAVQRGENMKIVLHMNYDNQNYTLTRCLERRKESSGESDADYIFEVFLQKEANIVSPADRDHFLKTAIPEAISRFYLFDGEILQQYENLLKSENDNSVIKDSIEDILGLPILEISQASLEIILKEYSQAFTKVSKKDARTKEAAAKLAGLEEKDDELKKSVDELQKEIIKAIADLGTVDDQLEKTDVYRKYTQDIKSCEAEISIEKEHLAQMKESVREDLDNLWEAHMGAVIEKELAAKIARKDALSKTLSKQTKNQAIHEILTEIVSDHKSDCNCPICNSSIDSSALNYIKNQILSLDSVKTNHSIQEEYSALEAEIHILQNLKCDDNTASIKKNLNIIESISTNIKIKENKKHVLEKERRNIAPDSEENSIGELMPEHDRLKSLISNYKNGIANAKAEIDSNKASMEKIRNQIMKNQSNIEIETAEKEMETCKQINSLFEEAIEKFKQNLKENVQKDATNYFTSVAHNSDYKELLINEEYGLEILTGSGVKVPHRSSGYVQVVAISLIAALHKNAPISGPIIMDSTFQRIDSRHKTNILESLPTLGKQVIVLAYPEEIQATTARNVLKGKLRKEITIEQLSSFNSIIKQ